MRPARYVVGLALALGATAVVIPADADTHRGSAAPAYELLSVNSRERPSNARTIDAAVSRTGRYVVFISQGTNLSARDIEGDRDLAEDVYLRDRREGTTKLVSLASGGRPARHGYEAAISPNGRYVAFCSTDPRLVKPDSFTFIGRDRDIDVFVRDLRTGITRRASTTWKGKEADDRSCSPQVANNGDTVFESFATNLVRRKDIYQGSDIFLWDWSSRRLRWISEGSYGGTISADASVVAFGDGHRRVDGDRNGHADVYVLVRATNKLRLVTRRADGSQLQVGCDGVHDVSADGRFVLVSCRDGAMADPAAPDAVTHLFLLDRRERRNTLVNRTDAEFPFVSGAALADDGRTVAFASSSAGSFGGLPADDRAVYVWRRGHGLTNLTPGADDTWSDGAIDLSGNGSYVVFTTDSRTISDRDPDDGVNQPQVDLFGVRVP